MIMMMMTTVLLIICDNGNDNENATMMRKRWTITSATSRFSNRLRGVEIPDITLFLVFDKLHK